MYKQFKIMAFIQNTYRAIVQIPLTNLVKYIMFIIFAIGVLELYMLKCIIVTYFLSIYTSKKYNPSAFFFFFIYIDYASLTRFV